MVLGIQEWMQPYSAPSGAFTLSMDQDNPG